MESGRMRHRVVIEQASYAGDAMGQGIPTWTTYATMWGDVLPLRGREFFEAQKTASEVTAKILIRYRSGINPAWRIRFGTKIFRIIEIINPGMRNKELQIMVQEQPQSTT
jgi:SPP1 family predicted phage head-tail adaptor